MSRFEPGGSRVPFPFEYIFGCPVVYCDEVQPPACFKRAMRTSTYSCGVSVGSCFYVQESGALAPASDSYVGAKQPVKLVSRLTLNNCPYNQAAIEHMNSSMRFENSSFVIITSTV